MGSMIRAPLLPRLRPVHGIVLAVGLGALLGACRSDTPDKPERLVQQGRAALVRGDALRAVSLLRRAVVRVPRSERAQRLLGRALVQAGRLREAEQALSRGVHQVPRSARLWMALGGVRQKRGRFDAAVRAFERARVLAPHDPDVPLALGRLYEQHGLLKVAASHYQQGLLAARVDARIRAALGLARLAKAQGHAEEAIGYLGRALRADPRRVDVSRALGEALLEVDRPKEARRVLLAARAVRPKAPGIAALLGQANQALGHQEEAAAALAEAVRQAPRDAASLRRLAQSLLALGRRDEAYAAGVKALALAPKDVQTMWLMVPLYLARGLHEPARKLLEALRGVRNHDATYWKYLGQALDSAGEHRAAYEAYAKASTLRPGNTMLRCLVGIVARRAGEYRAAVRHLRVCLASSSSAHGEVQYSALVNLAIAREMLGQRASARRLLRQAETRSPRQPEAWVYGAWIALRQGGLARAVRLAQRADLLAQGKSPHALDVLASALLRLGRTKEARRALERARSLPMDPQDRGYLQQRLSHWVGAPRAVPGRRVARPRR